MAVKAVYRSRDCIFRYTHDIDELRDGLDRLGTDIPEAVREAAYVTRFAREARCPDARDQLLEEPAGDLQSLRTDHRRIEGLSLPANREIVLDGLGGTAIEIEAELDPMHPRMVELNVLGSPGKEE